MTTASLLQYALFLLIVGLLVKPVGTYLARVFSGQRTWLDPILTPLERGIYRAGRPQRERNDQGGLGGPPRKPYIT